LKRRLTHEAGPTGYGLDRLIESLGHTCIVAAPSLIPKTAGERVKTNRRDAEGLARLLRVGEMIASSRSATLVAPERLRVILPKKRSTRLSQDRWRA
jgi:transposase